MINNTGIDLVQHDLAFKYFQLTLFSRERKISRILCLMLLFSTGSFIIIINYLGSMLLSTNFVGHLTMDKLMGYYEENGLFKWLIILFNNWKSTRELLGSIY